MHKLYVLAALALTLAGCDSLSKPTSPKGAYHLVGKLKPWHFTKTIQFTSTKATMKTFGGEVSLDYKAEDGFVYIGEPGGSLKYKQLGPDTLVNDSNYGYEGTYVKVSR